MCSQFFKIEIQGGGYDFIAPRPPRENRTESASSTRARARHLSTQTTMASENLVGDSEIMVGLDRSKPFWWHRLTDCDPISLEPLRRLRVEPFELTADGQVCDA